MASSEPLSIEKMLDLFVEEKEPPARDAIKDALGLIETECEARGVELKKVSSGYRFQARKDFAPWVSRLWEFRTLGIAFVGRKAGTLFASLAGNPGVDCIQTTDYAR